MRTSMSRPGVASQSGRLSAIPLRVRDREVRRQIRYNDIRKFAIRLADRTPALVAEFLKMTTGSLVGLWVIAELLAILGARPLYTLAALGLVYSAQAAYHKHRLAVDPAYRIPKCGCAGRRNDNSELVLQSRESSILRIPNSVLGIVSYAAILSLVYLNHNDAAMALAIAALCVSAYLSYVMIVRIRGLCASCVNIAAVNILILWQFLH
jgi:uncharacterized membrane protein